MIDRRSFLRMIGLAPVAGAASVVAPAMASGGLAAANITVYGERPSQTVLTKAMRQQLATDVHAAIARYDSRRS